MKRRERKYKYPKNHTNWFKKINIFKYLSLSLIILFILLIPTVIKKMIKINKIECTTQFGVCTQQFSLGDYLSVKDQVEKELKQNIQVNSYLIQYKIPSILKIDLILKKPKYAIKNLTNDFYLIDNEGLVISITSESNLPYILNDVNYTLGQVVSTKDIFALKLVEKVILTNSVSSVEIKKETLEVIIDKDILVKFPLEGDIDVLVGSLRLIFSRLNENVQGIRMEDVKEIDLRFKNPVLR